MPIYRASNGMYKIENVAGPGHTSYQAALEQLRAVKASQANAWKGKKKKR